MDRFHLRVLEEAAAPAPQQLLAALPRACRPVLLDSSDGSGASVLAWDPDRELSGRLQPGEGGLASVDPALLLQQAMAGEEWRSDEAGGALPAGWIGYWSFECGHAWEVFPWGAPDPAGLPDYCFGRYRKAVLWRPQQPAKLLWAEQEGQDESAVVERLRGEFQQLLRAALCAPGDLPSPPRAQIAAQQYQEQVRRLRRQIGQGEFFQANLSHRLSGPAPVDPRAFYACLRPQQPTALSAYWEDAEGRALLSWSPEQFLRVDGARLRTRPIKGTAPRSGDAWRDREAARALNASAKEVAELTMIVDMARNDLGRVATPGSVRVLSAGEIESFPTLYHRTATIEAQWDPRRGVRELMRATFPPASVTGAPKVRALRAIAALEQEARGPYCGAFGYWLPGADQAEFSVMIRTATVADGELALRVGAGIVWDSDPAGEWEETLHKARYLTGRHETAPL